MTITSSFKHVEESSEFLKAFIEQKSEPIERYFQGKVQLSWRLSSDKYHHLASVHLSGNHMTFHAEADSGDFRTSIEAAVHKLEAQIRKHKEKVTNHHKSVPFERQAV
jgi:putative sigma-54 modulation protein